MDDDKSLEQQASEDLAELEAGDSPDLSELACKLEQIRANLEALRVSQHSLINEMMVFRQRLDRLDPSFNQHNCSKCGAKLRHVGGKCHVCGLQN